jgi:cytochrome c biogenesis protein CcmG/thiol:disulfide interchange protein DsbE
MLKLDSEERDLLMKRNLFAVFLLLAIGLLLMGCSENSGPPTEDEAAEPEALAVAPEFDLEKLDGTRVTSADLKGKVVIVDFWATWCAPCIAEIPNYNELTAKYADSDVVLLGITLESGSKESVISEVNELGIKYPIVMGNDEVVQGFGGVIGYPTTFLVSKDWKVHQRYLGLKTNKKEMIEKDVEALLAQQ